MNASEKASFAFASEFSVYVSVCLAMKLREVEMKMKSSEDNGIPVSEQ